MKCAKWGNTALAVALRAAAGSWPEQSLPQSFVAWDLVSCKPVESAEHYWLLPSNALAVFEIRAGELLEFERTNFRAFCMCVRL